MTVAVDKYGLLDFYLRLAGSASKINIGSCDQVSRTERQSQQRPATRVPSADERSKVKTAKTKASLDPSRQGVARQDLQGLGVASSGLAGPALAWFGKFDNKRQ
jgi:hypothetical protein